MSKKLTTEEYINNVKLIHGEKYDYSLTNYINNRTPIKIICKIHGIFNMLASSHNRGYNCPKCSNIKKGLNRCSKEEIVIKKFKKTHNDKYDYSNVKYVNGFSKVNIICKKHGTFLQTPNLHLQGSGCPKCVEHKNFTTDLVIDRFKKIYNDKYDYSLVKYTNNHKKIDVICTVNNHGVFSITPAAHIKSGCPKCGKNYRFSNEEIVEEFKKVHGNEYDYSKVQYKNAHKKVIIICKEHGEFTQEPNSHKIGTRCPQCCDIKNSKGSLKIKKFLLEKEISFIVEHKFNDCKYKNKLPFDYYLPEFNICIEFQGQQHYKAISLFGGEEGFNKQIIRDKIKMEYCRNNNIPLIVIKYDENIEYKLKHLFECSKSFILSDKVN